MEPSIAYWSSIAFTGFVVVLSVFNYFFRRSKEAIEKPSTEIVPPLSSPPPVQPISTSQNRRKNAKKRERRRANKTEEADVDPSQPASPAREEEEQKDDDDEEEFEDATHFDEPPPPATHVEDEQTPTIPLKPRSKPKSAPPPTPPDDESSHPSKPHACVAPVKQRSLDSPPSFSPRLRPSIDPVGSKRKSNGKTAIPLDSAARKNDFVPSKQQPRSSHSNGYSSGSDLNSGRTPCSASPSSPFSASDTTTSNSSAAESFAPRRVRLDELISVFETNSFTGDELQVLLDKVTSKHPFSRPDWQRLSVPTTAKNEKIIERLVEENNRHQLKLLAIELQAEQTRARELAKTNAELDQTMRQLQQQKQQQPPTGLVQYQQTVHSYQMQLKRLSDENSQLVHQLTAYSMMPGTLNELKQQQQILLEQMRQFNLKSSALEQEIADGDRASKNAAEIYQKADAQKQDRIEQMIADLNRYKKIDKDLAALRQKHQELEKNSPTKLKELAEQRDELEKLCQELQAKVEQLDQLKARPMNPLEDNLHEVKAKHELLQQRNCKLIEQFKKLTEEQIQSS